MSTVLLGHLFYTDLSLFSQNRVNANYFLAIVIEKRFKHFLIKILQGKENYIYLRFSPCKNWFDVRAICCNNFELVSLHGELDGAQAHAWNTECSVVNAKLLNN